MSTENMEVFSEQATSELRQVRYIVSKNGVPYPFSWDIIYEYYKTQRKWIIGFHCPEEGSTVSRDHVYFKDEWRDLPIVEARDL